MELFLLFLLVPALFAYLLQWAFFNKVNHKYWKNGSLLLVAPPILLAFAATKLMPNATQEWNELIMACWATMSLGVVLGWGAARIMDKIQKKMN